MPQATNTASNLTTDAPALWAGLTALGFPVARERDGQYSRYLLVDLAWVRVVSFPDDGNRVEVHVFQGSVGGMGLYSVTFGGLTPVAVVVAAVDAVLA